MYHNIYREDSLKKAFDVVYLKVKISFEILLHVICQLLRYPTLTLRGSPSLGPKISIKIGRKKHYLPYFNFIKQILPWKIIDIKHQKDLLEAQLLSN